MRKCHVPLGCPEIDGKRGDHPRTGMHKLRPAFNCPSPKLPQRWTVRRRCKSRRPHAHKNA
eukprot:10198773-Alexandrium_andersonii.AAC.1